MELVKEARERTTHVHAKGESAVPWDTGQRSSLWAQVSFLVKVQQFSFGELCCFSGAAPGGNSLEPAGDSSKVSGSEAQKNQNTR